MLFECGTWSEFSVRTLVDSTLTISAFFFFEINIYNKGVYVLLFSLSMISVFSCKSASFLAVFCVLFLHMNHRRYFKIHWTGKPRTAENFLLSQKESLPVGEL